MQEFAAEGRLRSVYGRFKPGRIAYTSRPAISLDLLLVDLQNFIQRQKYRFHPWNSLGQFSEGAPVALVCQFLSCLELLTAR